MNEPSKQKVFVVWEQLFFPFYFFIVNNCLKKICFFSLKIFVSESKWFADESCSPLKSVAGKKSGTLKTNVKRKILPKIQNVSTNILFVDQNFSKHSFEFVLLPEKLCFKAKTSYHASEFQPTPRILHNEILSRRFSLRT